jgi:hypothetical protein
MARILEPAAPGSAAQASIDPEPSDSFAPSDDKFSMTQQWINLADII